jgi:hypothetical protein
MQSNRINNSSYLSSGIHWIEDNPRKILILLGILINSIIFYDFIFGNKLYVFGKNMVDSADFTYPHLMHAIRYLKTQSYPGYSFYIGLGQGYYPFYSLYLSSLIPPLMYGNELLGVSTTEFMGWFNYFASPWFYCGIFTLLLIPQSFRNANGKWSISSQRNTTY